MTRFRWLVLGGLVGFLLAAGYLRFQLRSEYRSVGRIRILAPIAEWYVPSTGTATEQATLIRQIRATALATSTLQNIIATYGLYPGELDRLPAATVVNKFRKNLEITVTEGQIIVSCTYTDPTLAQKVAADLLGRMVSEYSRESLLQAEATWHFMEARFGQVATQLADAKRDLQNARGGATSVLQMNVELARDAYRQTHRRLTEVQAASMVSRRLGPSIEPIDTASMPTAPVTNKRGILLAGTVVGLLLGYFISRLKGTVKLS